MPNSFMKRLTSKSRPSALDPLGNHWLRFRGLVDPFHLLVALMDARRVAASTNPAGALFNAIRRSV
jgi:hypothetical protein